MTHTSSFMQPGDLEKAQLGLGHSYSRAKVKFNVNRVDNMVIQAIFLLDTLDKDINSFSMRVRFATCLPYYFGLFCYFPLWVFWGLQAHYAQVVVIAHIQTCSDRNMTSCKPFL